MASGPSKPEESPDRSFPFPLKGYPVKSLASYLRHLALRLFSVTAPLNHQYLSKRRYSADNHEEVDLAFAAWDLNIHDPIDYLNSTSWNGSNIP